MQIDNTPIDYASIEEAMKVALEWQLGAKMQMVITKKPCGRYQVWSALFSHIPEDETIVVQLRAILYQDYLNSPY